MSTESEGMILEREDEFYRALFHIKDHVKKDNVELAINLFEDCVRKYPDLLCKLIEAKEW